MKIRLLVTLTLCCFALAASADSDVAIHYGSGGGPMPTLLFLDLDDLNDGITDAGYPQINQVMFALGGGAYGGALNGIRVGGFGASGDTHSVSESHSSSLDLSYGGIIIEKAADTTPDVNIVLGTMLGFGDLDLRLIGDVPTSFEDAVTNPFISSMSKEFLAVQPYVALESRPCSWMWARFQLGFLWTLADPWTFEEAEFSGPPRTLGGLSASLMIRFGKDTSQLSLDDVEATLEDIADVLEGLDESEDDEPDASADEEGDRQPTGADD